MKRILPIIAALVMASCSQVETETVPFDVEVSGEMLFEGANTLQGEGSGVMESLAKKLEISPDQMVDLQVMKVEIDMQESDREVVESFLLQIVSDNEELKSLASLNPVSEGGGIALNMAEEAMILEYLKDSGTAWVLDLNLSEDHMEEMAVTLNLEGQVEFKSE